MSRLLIECGFYGNETVPERRIAPLRGEAYAVLAKDHGGAGFLLRAGLALGGVPDLPEDESELMGLLRGVHQLPLMLP